MNAKVVITEPPFIPGMRVRQVAYRFPDQTCKHCGSMLKGVERPRQSGVVVSVILRELSWYVRVHRDHIKNPETWAAELWEDFSCVHGQGEGMKNVADVVAKNIAELRNNLTAGQRAIESTSLKVRRLRARRGKRLRS